MESEKILTTDEITEVAFDCFSSQYKRTETDEVEIYSVRKVGWGWWHKYEIYCSELEHSVLGGILVEDTADTICKYLNNAYRVGWIDGISAFSSGISSHVQDYLKNKKDAIDPMLETLKQMNG